MQGINFPATLEVFLAGKPADMTIFTWCFHPANPYRFPLWVLKLLQLLRRLSRLTGKAFPKQKWLAKVFKISLKWLEKVIARLKQLGLLIVERHRQNFYRINDQLLNTFSINGDSRRDSIASENATTGRIVMVCEPEFPSDMEPLPNNSRDHGSIIPASSDDETSKKIIAIFEKATGTEYNHNRDREVLNKLKTYGPLCAITGVLLSAGRATKRIRSLGYCLGAAQELSKAKMSERALKAYVIYIMSKLKLAEPEKLIAKGILDWPASAQLVG